MCRVPSCAVFTAIAALGTGGCVSRETIAPPVTAALLGASHGSTAATLEEGRRIFTGACATCHAADPVAKHSTREWGRIVADMAGRTKLTPPREAALLAYLAAARATLPAP